MHSKEPFLPGFAKLLFGRRRSRHIQSIRRQSPDGVESLFSKWIPQERLYVLATQGANLRNRVFTPSVTFWAFLWQVLTPGASCRAALRNVQATTKRRTGKAIHGNTSAYCQARLRLPVRSLIRLGHDLGIEIKRRSSTAWLWCGREVKVIDGTGVSMPDTKPNQKRWPQPSGQKEGCGFPTAEIVGVFCLHTGALLNWVQSKWSQHEASFWQRLWRFFKAGDIILGDRAYCSYASMVWLKERGVDTVCRMHQRRRSDFRQGKRLGEGDRLITLTKLKQRSRIWDVTRWKQLPSMANVRMVRLRMGRKGFRTTEVILYTTLLDPIEYPIEELAKLYLRRWQVEIYFRDIKISQEMDVLRCQTPGMIMREMAMNHMAYNLIRMMMTEAALTHGLDLRQISFKGSLDALRAFGSQLDSERHLEKQRLQIYNDLIDAIAFGQLPPSARANRAQGEEATAKELSVTQQTA